MGIISITHFSSQLNYAERPGTPVRQRVVCLGRRRCEGASPSPLPCPPLFHAPLLCPSPTPSPRPRFLPVTPKYDVPHTLPNTRYCFLKLNRLCTGRGKDRATLVGTGRRLGASPLPDAAARATGCPAPPKPGERCGVSERSYVPAVGPPDAAGDPKFRCTRGSSLPRGGGHSMLDLLVIVQWPGPPDCGPLRTHASRAALPPLGPQALAPPQQPSREGRPAGLRSWALPDIRPLLS